MISFNIKKRQIISLLAFLALFAGCNNNTSEFKNDLERLNLKGKVKTLRWTPYEAVEKFGEVTKGDIDHAMFVKYYYETFNEEGYLAEYQDFDRAGDLNEKTVYKYNTFNKIQEENIYDPDGKLKEKTTYKYDENGNQVAVTNYDSDGSLIAKKVLEYDENGNQIQVQNINSKGEKSDKKISKYDGNNHIIEKNEYNPDGRLYNKVTYKYNNEGNIVEFNEYNEEGNIENKSRYSYDMEKDIIESEVYNSDGELLVSAYYEFNSNYSLQRTNIIMESSGIPLHKWLEFSVVGIDIKNLKYYNSEGRLEINGLYEYEYDDQGNWIKRIEVEDDKARKLVEREITYY